MAPRKEICLDANVFVAGLIRSEPHHLQSLEVLVKVRQLQVPLFEPALVVSEVAAALYRKKMDGEITAMEAKELLEHFYQLPTLILWQEGFVSQAFDMAVSLAMKSPHDCTYLAVAMARSMPLITLDAELIKKGRKIYSQIHSPNEWMQKTAP